MDDIITRQITEDTLPPITAKEIVEFNTQANEDQQYNTQPTNPIPNMQNEGAHTDTHSTPTRSTTIPTAAGTSSRGRQ